jgi:plasmid stabilization system protein ParE
MNFFIRYTDTAEADLLRNSEWWAENHSLEQALEWEDEIRQQIATLNAMPERHALAPENPGFPFDMREELIGLGSRPGYRAVYTIVESEVRVLAIRRGSQDVITPDDL